MKAIRFEMLSPEGARRCFLLMSCLALACAVFGHLAFAQHWPNFLRIFEVGAVLSAPLCLCGGVMVLLQHQRSWQVVVGVSLSGIACVVVSWTIFRLIHGLYWA